MNEACVSVSEQKVRDLGDLVVRLKAEADDERKEHQAELEKEKQVYCMCKDSGPGIYRKQDQL